jgi:hydrogenase maturation protease
MHELLYLIVGVGNTLRRDDGAGILLAETAAGALAEQGHAVEIRLLQQLLPEMAEEICELGAQTVLIADCRADSPDARDGWVRRLVAAEDGRQIRRKRRGRLRSQDSSEDGSEIEEASVGDLAGMGSHGLGAAALIELARRLYGFEGEAWLATVPGVDFDHGEGLSPATREAIDHLVPAIMGLIS